MSAVPLWAIILEITVGCALIALAVVGIVVLATTIAWVRKGSEATAKRSYRKSK